MRFLKECQMAVMSFTQQKIGKECLRIQTDMKAIFNKRASKGSQNKQQDGRNYK
jgi:hypothetical protein